MRIETIDLDFQGISHSIASYLIEGPAGYLLVETGPMSTLETLRRKLREKGLAPEDIHDVVVTHIHLDHAGAAGWWARQGARIHVHHVGAPHLIDPAKLWRSASRIYGDKMEILWGDIVPAPADRVNPLADGETVDVAGLSLVAMDTPGHAGHNHLFRLGDIAFAGDAAGIRIPGSPWVSLPAPPPEFNRELWEATLDRLEGAALQSLYLTHFGRVDDPSYQLEQLRIMLDAATAFVRREMDAGTERDELVRRYVEWNREQAVAANMAPGHFEIYEAANPLSMSVDGIMRYWQKKEEAAV